MSSLAGQGTPVHSRQKKDWHLHRRADVGRKCTLHFGGQPGSDTCCPRGMRSNDTGKAGRLLTGMRVFEGF